MKQKIQKADLQSTSFKTSNILNIKSLVQMGMLSAIALVLMLFEFPLPFAPSFYELDFSEVPVIIGAFALGPIAGVFIELVKILLNFIVNGTVTAGIGELANFLMGCSFVVPAALIYKRKKCKKNAVIGLVVGLLSLTVIACVLNAYVLLPAYSKAFHMPIDELVALGNAVNPSIDNLASLIMLATAPFNLLKGSLVAIITCLIYKKISFLLKSVF